MVIEYFWGCWGYTRHGGLAEVAGVLILCTHSHWKVVVSCNYTKKYYFVLYNINLKVSTYMRMSGRHKNLKALMHRS